MNIQSCPRFFCVDFLQAITFFRTLLAATDASTSGAIIVSRMSRMLIGCSFIEFSPVFWFDLESGPHELFRVLVDRLLGFPIPVFLCSPALKVPDQLLLHIAHVEPNAADSQSREWDVRDKLGSILQDCHNLTIRAVAFASKTIMFFKSAKVTTKITKGANRYIGFWL